MVDLVINSWGNYTDCFIVSFDGGPYVIPEKGTDFAVRLRGRLLSRYASGGIDGSYGDGADEEGTVIVF